MSTVCEHGKYVGDDEACGYCQREEQERHRRIEQFVERLAEDGLTEFPVTYRISQADDLLITDISNQLKKAAKRALEEA
jgi:hypothetical protein